MKRAPGARPSHGILAAGLIAFAVLAWSVPAVRAGTPEHTAGAKEPAPPAEHLPKAQSGQIALPVHPREPEVSPMAHGSGARPTPQILDQFQIDFLVGGVYPTGLLDRLSDNGLQVGIQGTYYPYPRLGFGLSLTRGDLGVGKAHDTNPINGITELALFSKIHLREGRPVSPYVRVTAGFYQNGANSAELVDTAPDTGAPRGGGLWTGGVGVGIGFGLQFRTGTPTGWFLETLIQNEFADPHRAYVYTGVRGGLSFTLGGHRGVR